VGSYPGSASPYGTFDQGGNAWEWNKAIIDGFERGVRGGSYQDVPTWLAASGRNRIPPSMEDVVGIRLVMIPEPTTALLLAGGLAGLAVARRRR
jgi:formylglycine-generating enzyme required for sulfatase activity